MGCSDLRAADPVYLEDVNDRGVVMPSLHLVTPK